MQEKLRNEAKALLEQGKVDYIIGFEPGTLKFTTTPLITRNKEEVDRLIINPFTTNNLAKGLLKLKGKAGIVAKGCDARSIVSLIQDKKVVRENIVILGLPCAGLIDLEKIEKLTGKGRDEIEEIALKGDKVTVKAGGETKEFAAKEALYDNCLACEFPTPAEYDILLGEPVPAHPDKAASEAAIKELEAKTPAERWAYWKEEFSRCTRCYACRNVCPICYCERCFAEETEPQWIQTVPKWQDNLIFQITRNLHDAGRCTDCGACERACPVHIPLRSLTKKMYDIVDDLFEYKAGNDKNAPPFMVAYESNEAEELFR